MILRPINLITNSGPQKHAGRHTTQPTMNAASKLVSRTHTRTEGRAPVWGSEFTTIPLHNRGIQ